MRPAHLLLLASALLYACSGADSTAPTPGSATPAAPDPVAPTAASAAPANGTAASASAESGAIAEPPASEPESEPIDLLHAIPTAVSVSSAYRDDPAHAAKLVDGDLETAWNSRTDDLVGAWIDVALPAEARVTSIALTAGFTHRTESTDLFEGNHRVTRVRVLRDGTEVGAHELDPASRELQSIPVSGAGGTYRVEVAAVAAGSRATWREVCISELRVMGHAPSARPGTVTPRVAVGALPAIDSAPAAMAPTAVAPAVPAGPGPPRLAALGATLAAQGVERLYRTEDIFAYRGVGARQHATVTAGADRSGTWLCARRPFGPARCVVVSSARVAVHRPSDRRGDAVAISYLDADRSWIEVQLPVDGAPPSASRRAEHAPVEQATPIAAPAGREPPAWLDSLDGLEIVSSRAVVAATVDGWLTICRGAAALECALPTPIEPLRRDGMSLTDVDRPFGEVCSVGLQWTVLGDREVEGGAIESEIVETGQATVFVRVQDSLALLATAVTAMDRRTPSTERPGATDVLELESFDTDLYSETCLQAGRPTCVRRREDADGGERALGAIAFARAPDELPPTGVSDPLAISMEGAWEVLPQGGLRRRSRRCPED